MLSAFGSFQVYYGSSCSSTVGFNQADCISNIQGSHLIGFWCQWNTCTGDGSVMMIGGGGSGCNRADHGIGLTENNLRGRLMWGNIIKKEMNVICV